MESKEVKDLEKMRIEKIMKKIKLSSTYGMLNDRVKSKDLEIKEWMKNE